MKLYVYKINNFMVLGYHYRDMMTVYNLRNHSSDKIQEVGNNLKKNLAVSFSVIVNEARKSYL